MLQILIEDGTAIKEQKKNFEMVVRAYDFKNNVTEAFTYFNPKHLSLRENLRVDLVV